MPQSFRVCCCTGSPSSPGTIAASSRSEPSGSGVHGALYLSVCCVALSFSGEELAVRIAMLSARQANVIALFGSEAVQAAAALAHSLYSKVRLSPMSRAVEQPTY